MNWPEWIEEKPKRLKLDLALDPNKGAWLLFKN